MIEEIGMYTAEQLNTASHFSKSTKCKGILTPAEALEYARCRGSLVAITSRDLEGVIFFTDDHCFGVGVLPSHFIPCTSSFPMHVVPRAKLPDGVINSIEKYLDIFGSGHRVISTMEELLEHLNGPEMSALKYYPGHPGFAV